MRRLVHSNAGGAAALIPDAQAFARLQLVALERATSAAVRHTTDELARAAAKPSPMP